MTSSPKSIPDSRKWLIENQDELHSIIVRIPEIAAGNSSESEMRNLCNLLRLLEATILEMAIPSAREVTRYKPPAKHLRPYNGSR